MACRPDPNRRDYTAVVVLLRSTPTGQRQVLVGEESVYALETTTDPLYARQFIPSTHVSLDEAEAQFETLANDIATALGLPRTDLHVPPVRCNSRGAWECRPRILPPRPTLGLPKGGNTESDALDPIVTALREVREELGVDLTKSLLVDASGPGPVHVFVADVTTHPLRDTLVADAARHAPVSELFRVRWVDANDPAVRGQMNQASRTALDLALRKGGRRRPRQTHRRRRRRVTRKMSHRM